MTGQCTTCGHELVRNGFLDTCPTCERFDDIYGPMIASERARADALAIELANARQLITDHCDDEEKVRAILKEFDKSDSHGSDGPIELAERAAEALKVARADRDVLAKEVRRLAERMAYIQHGNWIGYVHADAGPVLSRANGGGE